MEDLTSNLSQGHCMSLVTSHLYEGKRDIQSRKCTKRMITLSVVNAQHTVGAHKHLLN
jgi:hypothetical protein